MAYLARDCMCRTCAPSGSRHRAKVKRNQGRIRRIEGKIDLRDRIREWAGDR